MIETNVIKQKLYKVFLNFFSIRNTTDFDIDDSESF